MLNTCEGAEYSCSVVHCLSSRDYITIIMLWFVKLLLMGRPAFDAFFFYQQDVKGL